MQAGGARMSSNTRGSNGPRRNRKRLRPHGAGGAQSLSAVGRSSVNDRSSLDGLAEKLTVLILHSPFDRAEADALAQFLFRAGIEVASVHDGELTADAAVALLSPAALADEPWRDAVATTTAARIVPVALQDVDASLVPERLRPINWILWRNSRVTTFGTILAAIQSNPTRHRLSRQFAAEAEAWERGGRPADLLIGDYHRSSEAVDLLRELQNDPLAFPSRLTTAFIQQSHQLARRRHRRSIWKRTIALVTVLGLALVALRLIPRIRMSRDANGAAIVTLQDRATVSELPEWSGLLSGALLLNGSAAQKNLARQTLRAALSVPWSLGSIDVGAGLSIEAMQPLSHGTRAAVVLQDNRLQSRIGVVDVRRGAMLWQLPMQGAYWRLDVSLDERRAVVVGTSGVSLIDLTTRRTRRVAAGSNSESVRLARNGQVVVATRDGRILVVSPTDGMTRSVGRFKTVLDLKSTSVGEVRALVQPRAGMYVLIDALTGRRLASATLRPPVIAAGGSYPDKAQAVVVGADHQLWRIGPDREEQPLGIAVPDRTQVVTMLSQDRIVLGGQAERAHVVHLPTRANLGVVCREVNRLVVIQPSPDDETIACLGVQRNAIWSTPSGPTSSPSQLSSGMVQVRGKTALQARGSKVRITRQDPEGARVQTGWFQVSQGRVSAVALSPDTTRAVIASRTGAVVVLEIGRSRVEAVATWHSPDGSAGVAVGWAPGPVIRTHRGLVWKVPDCAGCSTDAGLLARLRERLSGCWKPTQLATIDMPTLRRLGAWACSANPRLGS
jgi:hypothetical protein